MNKLPVYEITTGNEAFDTWVLFDQAHRAVSKARARQLHSLGMEPGQTAVLFVLINTGGRSTSKEISELLGRELHTITGFVNRLEKAGLVKRTKEPSNKRYTRISLTSKGRDAYRNLSEPNAAVDIFARLKRGDRACLVRSLRFIRAESLKALHETIETRTMPAKMFLD